MPETIFSKKTKNNKQTDDFESLIFWSKFRFLGDWFRMF